MPRLRLLFPVVLLAAFSASAGTFKVTTGADSGPGSLRQAIVEANARTCLFCEIEIAVPRIDLDSELPALSAIGVTIEGPRLPSARATVSGASAGIAASGLRIVGSRRIRVSGVAFEDFGQFGIHVERSEDIGIHAGANGNGRDGVAIADSTIVTVNSSEMNGNRGNGVYATRTSRLEVSYSLVGVYRIDGDIVFGPRPNAGNGVHFHDVTASTIVGNQIRFNGRHGVLVTGSSRAVAFVGNSFESNGGLAIDLGGDGVTPNDDRDEDDGPNRLQNAPVIDAAELNRGAMRVRGHIRTAPRVPILITAFLADAPDPSGRGEGTDTIYPATRFEHAIVTTDDDGFARFELFYSESSWRRMRGRYVTALASHYPTSSVGTAESSEFSATVPIVDNDVTIEVSNTSDSGPGSLRAALEELAASADCRIEWTCEIAFRIPAPPGSEGVWTIQPQSPLPPVTRSGAWINAATQREVMGDTNPLGPEVEINGALCGECNGIEVRARDSAVSLVAVAGLAVNGFRGHGLFAGGESEAAQAFVSVNGCYVGTAATGTRAVRNGGSGIVAGAHGSVVIGFSPEVRLPGASNIISGNGQDGVSGDGFIHLERSRVGTDVTGLYAIANGRSGVRVRSNARISWNTIAFNREQGIVVTEPEKGKASLFGNSIHSNGLLGIDLYGDGVTENVPGRTAPMNRPVILSARVVGDDAVIRYTLDAARREFPRTIAVELFYGSFADGSGHGEGRTHVRSAFIPGGESSYEFRVPASMLGKFVAMTATPFDLYVYGAEGTTSEFSNAVQITAEGCPMDAPSLIAPADGARSGRITTFEWTAVQGASEYRLYIMRPGQLPSRMHTVVTPSATLNLEGGTYEWWVEAQLACHGTQSAHRTVVIE